MQKNVLRLCPRNCFVKTKYTLNMSRFLLLRTNNVSHEHSISKLRILFWMELLTGTVPVPHGTDDIYISDHRIKMARVGWRGEGWLEVCTQGGWGCKLFVFFSIVRHASTPCKMPAPRGKASQHHLLLFYFVVLQLLDI